MAKVSMEEDETSLEEVIKDNGEIMTQRIKKPPTNMPKDHKILNQKIKDHASLVVTH